MSRVGKAPIQLPKGVSIDIAGSKVAVKGPKGELSRTLHPDMAINLENGVLSVSRPSDSRQHRSLHGLTRALLNNMVTGVSAGYSKILLIEGVGYRAEMDGKRLVLYVGYSHPVYFEPDNGISYTVEERGRKVTITGIDKEYVGEIAARVRKQRPPEPYKGKGIRYEKEIVRRKAGKTGKV
ncbi:50S ribosomal subunit protein L6 [Candidatus Promineifilum breve]|uniref:Large ribosomal subunit protein uL6 n=1 Tax=Candidatus Promineifilum breve TaxID=1806508 RepID=A0A160T8P5_9CHLR|nr:50S ribosomal protein L6 [Candidatus Promineifilum breve]CUS05330.2 50S ribosomal subunit protein L6 [Candidatus Promineifilum breve]